MKCSNGRNKPGFTIVEVMAVILVIGVLVLVTVVSYRGITRNAVAAGLKSDLANADKQLKLFGLSSANGGYPTANNCPTPGTTEICLKSSGNNTYVYTVDNASNPKTFTLDAVNGTIKYRMTDSTSPVAVVISAPVLASNTATTITNAGATLGATVTSNGGETITSIGTCWATTPNPTTNCQALSAVGTLTPLSVPTIATQTQPWDMVISPDGKNVYTANYGANSISMFSRNLVTGALTALSPANAFFLGNPGTPWRIAISKDGTSIYVPSQSGNIISAFIRNSTTGLLTQSATPDIATAAMPYDIVVSPDDKHVYVTNLTGGLVSMYSRNTSTGLLTALSPSTIAAGSSPRALEISPDGKHVYVASTSSNVITMFDRNSTTGLLTAMTVPTISSWANPYGIAIPPDGKSLYTPYYQNSSIAMYSRDIATGSLAVLSPATIAANTTPQFVIVSSDGSSVYTTLTTSNIMYLYSRNATTGLLSALSAPTIATGTGPFSIVNSPDGKSIYVSNSGANTISMYDRIVNYDNPVAYTQARTGMPSNTLIYYRGYAVNSVGTSYSTDSTFNTTP